MWPFLATFAIAGGLLEAIRRIEERLVGEDGPRPKRWTLRVPDQPAHFTEPQQLEADIWAKNRDALGVDFWADQRCEIGRYAPGDWTQPHLSRRRFILEQMGDGPNDHEP
jgi:hypothetical protein